MPWRAYGTYIQYFWQNVKCSPPRTALCSCSFYIASSSSSILERSRSSGRLVATLPTTEGGQLERTSAASTSALSRSGVTGASSPTSATTTCTTTTTRQPPPPPPSSSSAALSSSNLSTQIEQNGCGSKNSSVSVTQSSVTSLTSSHHQSELHKSHQSNAKKDQKSNKTESKTNVSTASVTSLETETEERKTKKVFHNWKNKASMSKLGKGTRSLVSSWSIFFSSF